MYLRTLMLAVLATPVVAQPLEMPENDVPYEVASPFAFVESGGKAERLANPPEDDSGARVIGGVLADEGEWPWQVALVFNGGPVGPGTHFCGGSMVLDTWVLTAAHCIHMQDPNGVFRDLNPQAISVVVGTNELAPGRGDVVPIAQIFRHPSYVGTDFDNDIALIKLARPPQAPYRTIQVPDAQFGDRLDQPGVRTTVTGWGLTEGGQATSRMREADIQMLSREMCNQVMLEASAKDAAEGIGFAVRAFGLDDEAAQLVWEELISHVRPPMTENMLCSGTFEGGKTSCNGDSGGPLVVQMDNGNFVQAGVVSWGMSSNEHDGCLETALFSAYVRVSNYVGWLNQTINANN